VGGVERAEVAEFAVRAPGGLGDPGGEAGLLADGDIEEGGLPPGEGAGGGEGDGEGGERGGGRGVVGLPILGGGPGGEEETADVVGVDGGLAEGDGDRLVAVVPSFGVGAGEGGAGRAETLAAEVRDERGQEMGEERGELGAIVEGPVEVATGDEDEGRAGTRGRSSRPRARASSGGPGGPTPSPSAPGGSWARSPRVCRPRRARRPASAAATPVAATGRGARKGATAGGVRIVAVSGPCQAARRATPGVGATPRRAAAWPHARATMRSAAPTLSMEGPRRPVRRSSQQPSGGSGSMAGLCAPRASRRAGQSAAVGGGASRR